MEIHTGADTKSIHITVNSRYKNLEQVYAAFGGDDFRLDLGCGYVKPKGFIGIDNLSGLRSQIEDNENAPDIFMDLNSYALPFLMIPAQKSALHISWNTLI